MQFFKPLETGGEEKKQSANATEKVKCLIVGSGACRVHCSDICIAC